LHLLSDALDIYKSPELHIAYAWLISEKLGLSEYPKIIENFDAAIALRPDDPNPYLQRAAFHLVNFTADKINHQHVTQDLEKIAALDPNRPQLHAIQALVQLKLKRRDQAAIAAFSKAL